MRHEHEIHYIQPLKLFERVRVEYYNKPQLFKHHQFKKCNLTYKRRNPIHASWHVRPGTNIFYRILAYAPLKTGPRNQGRTVRGGRGRPPPPRQRKVRVKLEPAVEIGPRGGCKINYVVRAK